MHVWFWHHWFWHDRHELSHSASIDWSDVVCSRLPLTAPQPPSPTVLIHVPLQRPVGGISSSYHCASPLALVFCLVHMAACNSRLTGRQAAVWSRWPCVSCLTNGVMFRQRSGCTGCVPCAHGPLTSQQDCHTTSAASVWLFAQHSSW